MVNPLPESDAIASLAVAMAPLDLTARLRLVRDRIAGRLVVTTSFGLEDQALTHAIVEAGIEVAFCTLDTGRLFGETLDLWADTEARYGIRIAALAPRGAALEPLLQTDGPLGFRRSVAAREACCAVRKVEPLSRALHGAEGWITGLRADQSVARSATAFAALDAERGLAKLNPLADWTRADVERFVERHRVPINPLHAAGFPSIGCQPCTRPVAPGEPERAGRWWWEQESKKECGLHLRGTPARPSQPALG